jgi:L-ascorbate metabolism protein UlaG (beta-lactamase superfamily)
MISRRKALKYIGFTTLAPSLLRANSANTISWRNRLSVFNSSKIKPIQIKPTPAQWSNDTITIAWIGHSTTLINFFGTIILTDPVLTNKIGVEILGLLKVGSERLVEPALNIDEIPRPHFILLSHAHMDHMDIETICKFPNNIPLIVAKNTSDVLENTLRKKVIELDWGEKYNCSDVHIEALRVKHFGWRYPWEEDRSRGNWNGRSFNAYLLSKNDHYILFGGDTAYQQFFEEVGKRGIYVDCALMPIGAYNPWIHNHCNPEQALEMAQHANAHAFLPIHWGTFIQSNEPTQEPIERVQRAIPSTKMNLGWTRQGETWSLNEQNNTLTKEGKVGIL